MTRRFLAALPACLEGALARCQGAGAAPSEILGRVCEDVALLAHVASRFLADKGLREHPQVRLAALHLRKVAFQAVLEVVARRVSPGFVERYQEGSAELDASNEFGAFYALAGDDQDAVDRTVMAAAERAFYRWLEDVCLDESNRAFELEGSPFDDRAREVLRAVAADGEGPVARAGELRPFLRRPRNRDCARVLERLERWFLRQYDVHHGAVMINHAARLAAGRSDPGRTLSWHSRATYLLALLVPALPFVLSAFFYREPWRLLLDVWVSVEVLLVIAVALWLFVVRFVWRRDLTFFRAAVPRMAAGIIVGYLPVFLIDEVWDLAGQSWPTLAEVIVMLGAPTLLYIYVEVQRKLGDRDLAFRRSVDVFLLGLLQSAAFGLVVTSLLGGLMAARNWGGAALREHGARVTVELLRGHLDPFVGVLPRILGVEPFVSFPTAVLLMTFLAFFIGTFLQLLWEDLPITEPM